MKNLRKLERSIHWMECVHLGLLTLCLALPIALLFTEDDPIRRLCWALGTLIPVQLIRVICERIRGKPLRTLLSLAVFGLSLLMTRRDHHWVYYLCCCVPMLLSGLLLPRPQDKLILTVPRFFTLVLGVPAFALGKALGVPMLAGLGVALTALLTLTFLVHTNLSRLLRDIRMSRNTQVSVENLVRQNRRVLLAFALLGTLILAAVPFLLQRQPEPGTVRPIPEYQAESTEPHNETLPEKEYAGTGHAEPLNLEWLRDGFIGLLLLLGALGLGILLFYLVKALLELLRRDQKKLPGRQEDGLTIEYLEEEAAGKRERERLSGYEKKIRRRYEKLILRRTEPARALEALTPTGLEAAAGLCGPAAETVHEIYRRTRYSPASPTKEQYAAFREAVKSLERK